MMERGRAPPRMFMMVILRSNFMHSVVSSCVKVFSSCNASEINMGDLKDNNTYQEKLLDYEEEDVAQESAAIRGTGESVKKGYVGIHSSDARDFLLKPELLRAIVDSGFEHPSEVQYDYIPQAILGN